MQDMYLPDYDSQNRPWYKKSGFWIVMLFILLVVSTVLMGKFYFAYQKAWKAYQIERQNLDKYDVIENTNNQLSKVYQHRIDSLSNIVVSIRKDLSVYESESKTKINEKYDKILRETDIDYGVDSNIKLAKRLLSINDKLRLDKK